jgi:hypothetical protein
MEFSSPGFLLPGGTAFVVDKKTVPNFSSGAKLAAN